MSTSYLFITKNNADVNSIFDYLSQLTEVKKQLIFLIYTHMQTLQVKGA